MAQLTNKRVEKALAWREILKRFDKTDLPVRDFCRVEGIQVSQLYHWKKRLKEDGMSGLMDRRQGRPHKVTEKVKKYIEGCKKSNPMMSAADISELVKKKFSKDISDRWVQNILKVLGLNDPRGPKPRTPVEREHGGKNDTSRT